MGDFKRMDAYARIANASVDAEAVRTVRAIARHITQSHHAVRFPTPREPHPVAFYVCTASLFVLACVALYQLGGMVGQLVAR